jgi:hypothetical protein
VCEPQNTFHSFIIGRLRHKHPDLVLSKNADFVSAFKSEVTCLIDGLERNSFSVPFIQKEREVIAERNLFSLPSIQIANEVTAEIMVSLLYTRLDSYSTALKSKFAAQATILLEKFSRFQKFSPEAEQACVEIALKKAVISVINFVGPGNPAPISMIENALMSQINKVMKNSLTRNAFLHYFQGKGPLHVGRESQGTSGNSLPLEEKNTAFILQKNFSVARPQEQRAKNDCLLFRLKDVRQKPIKEKIFSNARAHFQMLKMLNKPASKLLHNVSLEDFLESLFRAAMVKLAKEMTDQLMPLYKIESAMKLEVETLFEKLIQQISVEKEKRFDSMADSQYADVGTAQLHSFPGASSNFLSIRSDLLAVNPSPAEMQGLHLNPSQDLPVPESSSTLNDQSPDHSKKETDKKNVSKRNRNKKSKKRRVDFDNQNVKEKKLAPEVRSFLSNDATFGSETYYDNSSRVVQQEVSLGGCPVVDCPSSFPGCIISLRRHLVQNHFYVGFREALHSRGQLEHCSTCDQDLFADTWLEHHSRHHRLLDDQIQHLLLFQLGGLDVSYQCPFCRMRYISDSCIAREGCPLIQSFKCYF